MGQPSARAVADGTLRHSHSILSKHRNALIFQRKFFSDAARNPNNEPSKFFAYDFKGKFARFGFCAVLRTIDNDWSISCGGARSLFSACFEQIPSALLSTPRLP